MAKSNSGAARLFEFRDGRSDKFWEITVSGSSHTVRYGRVGANGQSSTKEFASAEKASADAEKLINQKLKKGYQEIQDKAEARSEKVIASKQERKAHEPFLEEIYNNPDSPDGYAIYADWLVEQGDPLGDFIHVQLQLERSDLDGEERKAAKKRESQLLKEHQAEWLDELAKEVTEQWRPEGEYFHNDKIYDYTFARGFLESLTIEYLFPEFATKLRRSSHARMLQRLTIRTLPPGEELVEQFDMYADKEWEYEDTPSLDALKAAKFPNLRELVLSEDDYGCHQDAPGIAKLLKHTPRLEVLEIGAHEMETADIFKAKLPCLRSLTIDHTDEYPLEILAKNASLKNLESIRFHPHALDFGDDDAYLDLSDIQAICRSKHLKSLKHITMQATNFGDEGIREIVESGLIERLETLRLPHGATTDAGVEILCNANLDSLKSIDLTGNYISNQALKKLRAKNKHVKAAELRDPNLLDEAEHLYMGDME